MNRISGATLPCSRPVLRKPPSSVLSQTCASSNGSRIFASVIGMVDPKGGLVITTSADSSRIALPAFFTPAKWPAGNSNEFKW